MRNIAWAILLTGSVLVIAAITFIPSHPNKINEWLWNETQDWLNKDPSHEISVIILLDQHYLNVHSINRTDVAEWLETEHNATIKSIGVSPFIMADIPATEILPIAPAPVVESMYSGTYPVGHLDG